MNALSISSVLIVGSATVDTIVQKSQRIKKIGGVVTYAGLTFSRLGSDVTVLSNISPRDRSIFRLYKEAGIRLLRGETILTTRFVNHLETGTRWQEMPKKARRIDPRRHYSEIKNFRHIHLGPLHPEDFHPDFLVYLYSSSRLVTLDLQGYVRRIRGKCVTTGVSRHLRSALLAADIVKASVRELETVLDTYQMEAEELVREFELKEILVTSGCCGGYLLSSGCEKIEFAAGKVESELDPTGAGDVFFAAYLFHRFHQEQSIAESLDQASIIAARQVAGNYIPFDTLTIQ
jgi:sugar/nucleoside kinase (ribokinase family)